MRKFHYFSTSYDVPLVEIKISFLFNIFKTNEWIFIKFDVNIDTD